MGTAQHPPDLKAHALAIYVEHGGAEASRKTGVPAPTIRSWAHRDGVATVAAQNTRAAIAAAQLRWEERRLALADAIGREAEAALGLVDEALGAGDARAAKDAAVTMAILVDKAELLSGGTTNYYERIEPEALERRAKELDEVARRIRSSAYPS
jgi:hypothetical protein